MFIRFVLPALALAMTTPAFAEPVSIAVPYGDLDLTKDAGRRALDARLARAARNVCGGMVPTRDLTKMRNYRACIADVRSAYQPQVELALNAANERRVAMLANKIALFARF